MCGYGIEAETIDGNDVSLVQAKTREVVELYVRPKSKPLLLEMNTTRLCCHKQGQGDIRSKEEIAKLAERDPLLRAEQNLSLTQQQKEKIWSKIEMEFEQILQDVQKDAWPTWNPN